MSPQEGCEREARVPWASSRLVVRSPSPSWLALGSEGAVCQRSLKPTAPRVPRLGNEHPSTSNAGTWGACGIASRGAGKRTTGLKPCSQSWGELSVAHPTLFFPGDSLGNYFACFRCCITGAALKQEEAQGYRWGYTSGPGSEGARPGCACLFK